MQPSNLIRHGRNPLGTIPHRNGWTLDTKIKPLIIKIIYFHLVDNATPLSISRLIRYEFYDNSYCKKFTTRKVNHVLSNIPFYFGCNIKDNKCEILYYLYGALDAVELLRIAAIDKNDYPILINKLKDMGIPLEIDDTKKRSLKQFGYEVKSDGHVCRKLDIVSWSNSLFYRTKE